MEAFIWHLICSNLSLDRIILKGSCSKRHVYRFQTWFGVFEVCSDVTSHPFDTPDKSIFYCVYTTFGCEGCENFNFFQKIFSIYVKTIKASKGLIRQRLYCIYLISCSSELNSSVSKNSANVISNPSQIILIVRIFGFWLS